ncbi:T9SS type B sorting domain-containing protein [Chitinophaga rhizophila]|uniref:Gliding motility-associated C-terminal domain-containing protein n=1 Tax=Chitinophaga rhizophila TaxID=2866212 RepID=A0ABS7G8B0_9BACT|nr:gliding motility-associated C-terminal domain-containing protein [Chitinophaga rhizophila]MBW8683907.1 gliding motility-associated C-terminal domain-containing protein [Chitinophaga rhizophila]
MLKLPNPMKRSSSASFRKVQNALCRIVLPLLLLFFCSEANAQNVRAVINPTGGTPALNDLKIEILSDGGIKVTRKGLLESYIRTDSSQGMRAFLDFKNSGYLASANLRSPSICYISPISGTGEYWDPFKVHIVGTIVDRYKNYPTGQTGTVTIIVSYVKNTNYFFMDYVLHMPQTSGFTKALLYQSEQVVMGAAAGDDPDAASPCAYGFVSPDGTTVGVYRDASCSTTPEAPRSHVYRSLRKFDSWEISVPSHRFYVNDGGSFPYNTVADGIDGNGRSMGIMKQLGAIFRDGSLDPDPMNFKTYRLLSGYGTTMTEFDSIKAMKDTIPVPGFAPVNIKFSNGTLSGNEGNTADGEQAAQGLTLTVSGGKLNAPAYVLVRYDAAYASNYAHPAVPGTDFNLTQEAFLVPAGDYTTPKTVTIPNLRVIGNDQLQYSRTLRLKLVSTCTSLLSISGTSEVDYTIVDDEPRTLTMNIDSSSLFEGHSSKARITLPIGITCPEDIVISFSRVATSTAGDTDYVVPPNIIIPANQTGTPIFNFSAKADKVLENTENLSLRFQGTILGIGVASQKDIQIKDSTFLNPAYSRIMADCVSPDAARPVPEGYTGFLGLHLPPGVTTEVTINMLDVYVDWDNSTAEDQIDFDLNYYSGLDFKITPGNTVAKIPFTVFADNLMEGPVPEYFNLNLLAIDDVGAGRVYNYVGPAVTIKDVDADSSMKLIVTTTPSTIREGEAGAAVTIAFPNGITSLYDVPVSISRGLSSQATELDLESPLPTNLVIRAGQNSVSFPANIRAKADNVLETDESLWIVVKPNGFTTDSSLITIQDVTGEIPGNKDMKIELVTPALKEGNSTGIRISFANTTLTSEYPININLSHDAASVAATTDYSIPATITLPAGMNNYTVVDGFRAVSDKILELDEALTVTGVSTTIPGLTVTGFSGTVLDATGDNPENKKITVIPSHTEMDEGGTGYSFTFSLPPGYTTEIPIVITPELATGSTAAPDDYELQTTPLTINSGATSVTTNVNILTDMVVEGDEIMVMGASLASALNGLQVVPATVIIKDKTQAAVPKVTVDTTTLVEGGAGAFITVTMPFGAVPSTPLNVRILRGLSSPAVSGFTGVPQTMLLSGNTVTIPVPIAASMDNILADDDKLVVVVEIDGAPADSITFNIVDVTINDPEKTKIHFNPEPVSRGNRVKEGETYTVRASFPTGVTSAKSLFVQVAAMPASEATSADYTGLPTTFTMNPGENFADFDIKALADKVIENPELVRFSGAVTLLPMIVVDSFDLYIDDATISDPSVSALRITFDSSGIHKGGGATKVTIGFVDPLVTSKMPITINVTPDPSSTADITNYIGLPTVVTIPADSNKITFFLSVPDNFRLEGTKVLQFAAGAEGFTFIAIPPLEILEITAAALTIDKISDAGEPSTDGAFIIKMPLVSVTDVTVSFRSVYNSDNIEPLPSSVIIPAGSTSVVVPVRIKDDLILQGDETLRITLTSAVAENNGNPINLTVDISPVLILVTDDENAPTGPKAEARKLLIEKLSDATQPSTEGTFRIRFQDTTLRASDNVRVLYSLSGTATSGIDYNILPGYAIIPKGESMVYFNLSPAGIRYAGPDLMVLSTLTSASSALPNVEWKFVDNPVATMIIYNRNIDTPVVNISTNTSQLVEGGETQFNISLSRAITVDIPVTVEMTNDMFRTLTLTGGDVSGNTIVVTIPKGTKEGSFKVRVNDNNLNDDDGWIKAAVKEFNPLSGGAPYYVGNRSEISNTVSDNDSLKVSFTTTSYALKVKFDTIGQPLPFTVQFNRPSSRIVTIYYEFYTPAPTEVPANTMLAEAPKDYDATVIPVLVMPGETSADIVVPVNSVEKDKIFGMRLLRATVASNQQVPAVDSIITATGLIQICMDCDSDGDGVPDYVERFITDGRWRDNNNGGIRVHPAMSPNHDGLGNEVLMIENIDKYPDNEVTIFNRWGGTVFTTKKYHNQTNNFNGRGNFGGAKNQDVPDGSYFFIVHTTDANGNKQRYTGFIVIKR